MKDSHKTYPVLYSDSEIKCEIEKLSRQIQNYKKSDILDDLIKDAVMFNIGYHELQSRESRRHSNLTLVLSCLSAFVAVASLLVAWFAYKSSEANTHWQDQQTHALSEIQIGIASLKEAQTKPVQKNSQKLAPNKAQPKP